ncbi:hypothetical protein LCGC14_0468940 [marine sediment metagenome]|uniref:Uncharacterized protein n=1 Tax=marine sediment metagenome TaxID=412755 RepID=A0A0F9VLN4_9ZZZZ
MSDAVYDKLDEISKVTSQLETKAYEAGELAKQTGDEDLFLRTEIVRLALDIADSITSYQHASVMSAAERLLTAVQQFYTPEQ